MAQALYRLLLDRDQSRELHVVAPSWSAGILARMPEVTTVVELPHGHGELALGQRRRLGKQLADVGFTQAIVLPRSAKAALVPWFANIPRRTGFRGEMRYGLINDMRPRPAFLDQTVKRFCWLGHEPEETQLIPLPNPRLATDPDNQARLRETLKLNTNRSVVALLPGAEYGPAKQWPAEYFRRLAGSLDSAGWTVWVLGSAKEQALGDAIVDGNGAANLCGHTSIVDAVDLLGLAAVAVSNDSGLMHVAAAVGAHVVGLYGSSSPTFTPPLTPRQDVIWRDLDCSPCFKRECPLGHLDCLKSISPDEVLGRIQAVEL